MYRKGRGRGRLLEPNWWKEHWLTVNCPTQRQRESARERTERGQSRRRRAPWQTANSLKKGRGSVKVTGFVKLVDLCNTDTRPTSGVGATVVGMVTALLLYGH